tara:strand:+ start:1061 stop:1786 length:726 start_codon:yes stop_codon:yes gene_type:complete
MALPKIATPFYEMKLPSTGETVKYRPFLVKEEKLLLMAMEGGKQKEISNVVKQIINNCTEGKISVEELPMFDIEYLFLQIRIKSVEDTVDISLSCNKCNESFSSTVDLKPIEVHFPDKKQSFKIQLTSDVGLTMKYPTLDMMSDMKPGDETKPEFIFDTISKCIDNIYDEEQVYNDFNKTELEEFVDSLPQEQFKKISDFFEEMPKLQHEIKFSCPKCKHKNTAMLTGLQDFFDSASPTTV